MCLVTFRWCSCWRKETARFIYPEKLTFTTEQSVRIHEIWFHLCSFEEKRHWLLCDCFGLLCVLVRMPPPPPFPLNYWTNNSVPSSPTLIYPLRSRWNGTISSFQNTSWWSAETNGGDFLPMTAIHQHSGIHLSGTLFQKGMNADIFVPSWVTVPLNKDSTSVFAK